MKTNKNKSIQNWRSIKFQPILNPSKYNKNGNCIYYETVSYEGHIIKHWKEYDKLNRVSTYKDLNTETNLQNTYTYSYNESTNYLKSESIRTIYPDGTIIHSTSLYNNGEFKNKTIYTPTSEITIDSQGNKQCRRYLFQKILDTIL